MISCLNKAGNRLVHTGYCCPTCETAAPCTTGHDKDCDAYQQRLAETRHEGSLKIPITQLKQMLHVPDSWEIQGARNDPWDKSVEVLLAGLDLPPVAPRGVPVVIDLAICCGDRRLT